MQTYPTGHTESHRMAEQIFREILPRHGMAVREEQIALCHEVLDTLYNKEISLCEAGVGTGKTLAYLVACILWQMNRPEQMKLPIVISTSGVALQDAILTEYLPDLSAILLTEGIIRDPITAVVRKGKERFVCDARLAERAALVHPKRTREKRSLRIAENILDIAKLPFPIPDPVSDYERQKYPSLQEYIAVEIIPEMQKKLRQGFGRAIRTEQDSCVVAILDERAGIGGKYHDAALAALPTCPTTEKIEDVQQFIREHKRPDYFL